MRTASLRWRSGGPPAGRPGSPRRRRSSLATPTTADEIRGAGRGCPHRLGREHGGGEVGAGRGWPWLISWRQADEHLGDCCEQLVPVWGNRRVVVLLPRIVAGRQTPGSRRRPR